MKRKLLILSVSVIALAVLTSLCLAQEEGEKKKVKALEFKIRGQLIPHPDKNEVKVMTDDFQVFVMPVNKGLRWRSPSRETGRSSRGERSETAQGRGNLQLH